MVHRTPQGLGKKYDNLPDKEELELPVGRAGLESVLQHGHGQAQVLHPLIPAHHS